MDPTTIKNKIFRAIKMISIVDSELNEIRMNEIKIIEYAMF